MDLNWDVGRIGLASAVNLNHITLKEKTKKMPL
jgi:hypothetical protein